MEHVPVSSSLSLVSDDIIETHRKEFRWCKGRIGLMYIYNGIRCEKNSNTLRAHVAACPLAHRRSSISVCIQKKVDVRAY